MSGNDFDNHSWLFFVIPNGLPGFLTSRDLWLHENWYLYWVETLRCDVYQWVDQKCIHSKLVRARHHRVKIPSVFVTRDSRFSRVADVQYWHYLAHSVPQINFFRPGSTFPVLMPCDSIDRDRNLQDGLLLTLITKWHLIYFWKKVLS